MAPSLIYLDVGKKLLNGLTELREVLCGIRDRKERLTKEQSQLLGEVKEICIATRAHVAGLEARLRKGEGPVADGPSPTDTQIAKKWAKLSTLLRGSYPDLAHWAFAKADYWASAAYQEGARQVLAPKLDEVIALANQLLDQLHSDQAAGSA